MNPYLEILQDLELFPQYSTQEVIAMLKNNKESNTEVL